MRHTILLIIQLFNYSKIKSNCTQKSLIITKLQNYEITDSYCRHSIFTPSKIAYCLLFNV